MSWISTLGIIVALIFAFTVIGYVVYTFFAGTGTSQCVLASDCPEGQDCYSCLGDNSCQPVCPDGETWDGDSCSCVSAATANWSCNTNGGFPYCVEDSSCDPKTDTGCYTGTSSCSSGCMFGAASQTSENPTPLYIYDYDTKKSDMIMYVFNDYPGDLSSVIQSSTLTSLDLCDGSHPSLPSQDSVDRGVSQAFHGVYTATAPTVDCTQCGSDTATRGQVLGSSKHNYYFQNLSTRTVEVDFVSNSNNSDHICRVLDGKTTSGRVPCIGKNASSNDYKTQSVKIDGKDYYFASSATKSATSKNSNDRIHIYGNQTCVFVDISCQKLSL